MTSVEAATEGQPAATRPFDLVKEFVIALVAVTALTLVLAAVFSSPDDKPITLTSWSKAAPE
jgi:hypothetical protein